MKPITYDGTTTSGTQPPKNMTHIGEGWYLQFDVYNKMSYKYISITETCLGQFNTYNPIYCKEIRRITRNTNHIFTSLDRMYQQADTHAYKLFHHMY